MNRAALVASVESDMESSVQRVEHGGRIAGSWLGPTAVVLAAAGILGFGLFGGTSHDSATPLPSIPVGSPVPVGSPAEIALPSTPVEPPPLQAETVPHLPAIASIQADPTAIRSAILPDGAEPGPLAVLGSRVFFATLRGELQSLDLVGWSIPTTIARVAACHSITDIAAAAGRAIWVEAWSSATTSTPEGCLARKATSESWRVWLSDVTSGTRRVVASGSSGLGAWSDSLEPAVSRPAVAITADEYALDLPTGVAADAHSTTIQVRDVRTGKLAWEVSTRGALDRLMLAGDRIAYLQHGTVLSTATRSHPSPVFVAASGGTFSLSPDGRYMAWDQGDGIFLADFRDPVTLIAALAAESGAETAAMPTVGVGPTGPIVAWRATDGNGETSLVVRPTPGIGPLVVANAPAPSAGVVQGTHLVWRAALVLPSGGTLDAVYSLDLAGMLPGLPIGPSAWVGQPKGGGPG